MKDLNSKTEELGKTLTEQFNLIAGGKFKMALHMKKMLSLSKKGQKLQDELAEAFGIPVTEPLETLQKIHAAAVAQKLSGTDELKQAIDLLAKIVPQLPENACPTPDGLEVVVKKALDSPKPPKP